MKQKKITFVMLFLLTLFSQSKASTVTANLSVTATVLSVCSVLPATLAFGNYNFANDSTVNTTITVTCTSGTDYHVRLGAGAGAGAAVDDRLMTHSGGVATLSYGLYRDGAYTQNWGQTDSTDTYDGTGNGAAQNVTVYGRILANQAVTAGAYTDTVVITVSY